MTGDHEDFLSRWSRKKDEARQEQADHQADPAPAQMQETSDKEALLDVEELKNTDFEALNFDSDYTRFMKDGVPDMIRRRALRKLWASDPILANLDGLNEYDEDYSDAALAVKVLESAWKPGKGYNLEDEPDTETVEAAGEGVEEEQATDMAESANASAEDEAEPPAGEDSDEELPV